MNHWEMKKTPITIATVIAAINWVNKEITAKISMTMPKTKISFSPGIPFTVREIKICERPESKIQKAKINTKTCGATSVQKKADRPIIKEKIPSIKCQSEMLHTLDCLT